MSSGFKLERDSLVNSPSQELTELEMTQQV